jgi:hypothetical protein
MLCKRQCAIQLAGEATALSREGAHGAAFISLLRGALDAPLERAVWSATVRCAARTLRRR